MKSKAVDNLMLKRWRTTSSSEALVVLSTHAKRDASFLPRGDQQTSRWHASVAGRDFELVCSGAKFYDTHARCGGAGAVDLAMYLFKLDFVTAVRLLKTRGL